MIPASYLFKNTYHQTWEAEEKATAPKGRPHFLSGLMTPLTAAITALIAKSKTRRTQHFGHHAYE